ncbi:MAG: alpha/beta hydrolase [Caldilineaceae bacterium]|nr:alpha/beta hydrolase [Caldilineaceae bacterium]
MDTHHDFADINGTRLHYETAGSGDPLVLIHGATLDIRMWDDQFVSFARHYQVIRYDMRGYGQSALPTTANYTPADDLMALLHHLGLTRAHILGLSLGGAVAIDFALTYPEATDTLIVVDTGLRAFQWEAFGAILSQVQSVAITSGIEAAKRHWLNGPLFAPAMENPQLAVRLKQIVTDYSGWHWVNNQPPPPSDSSPIEQLDGIHLPTLIIVGERDFPDFQTIAEILYRRIPNATKVVMSDVGHMSNMEDPERFNEIVLGFLMDKQY